MKKRIRCLHCCLIESEPGKKQFQSRLLMKKPQDSLKWQIRPDFSDLTFKLFIRKLRAIFLELPNQQTRPRNKEKQVIVQESTEVYLELDCSVKLGRAAAFELVVLSNMAEFKCSKGEN